MAPDWATLADAYGRADDIPALLHRLRDEDADALDDLYGHICHQGSIYAASIAAFPHLVSMAEQASDGFRADLLILAGAICESPALPDELAASPFADALLASLPAELAMSIALMNACEDAGTGSYLLKAGAAFAGFAGAARVLDGFNNAEFSLACPDCDAELFVWPAPPGLMVAAEDPVFAPSTRQVAVRAGPLADSPQYPAYVWLSAQLAQAPNLAEIAVCLPHLFGTASCPACDASFSLMDMLVGYAA